ncbi:uncharacterized protein AB675_8343 [Cyphellophora attinorum]|uniref:Uncharacterized protein n=1 Tax=Cyphellophora attinorum TaxID=1664694 RepID=A0A0N1P3W6_9EURO|nr:uncharacterized protein AB675_8343 [Phialophora attinorum]KPI44752.1 hypothetical protein AB675_8343 [Phialophora attinorum]
MPETITDHARDSTLGTPDIPSSQTVFVIHATTKISAPASLVFRTLRNTDTWRDWNKFCPRVTIIQQPPEAEDEATLAEIQELVRNTSVAGSVDSAITDGAAGQGTGLIGRRMSVEEEDDVRAAPPPVTTVRLRASIASQGGRPSTGSGRPKAGSMASGGGEDSAAAMAAMAVANVNALQSQGINGQDHARKPSDGTNGGHRLSAAQKFQQSTEQRKASIASGERPESPNNVLVEAPHDPNVLVPAPKTPAGQEAAKTQQRRTASVSAATKRKMSINAIYGEPSVRIQMNTRMNLHLRMRLLQNSLGTDRELAVIVNEVSRPEDNEEALFPGGGNSGNPAINLLTPDGEVNEEGMRRVSRMATHVAAKQPGVYRIVWSMNTQYAPPRSYPKWMLQAQRVHEIRKVVRGDGKEECVYEDWECWRGMLAGRTEKKYKRYWVERAEGWGKGLGEYCEAMGGDVERRDFVGR